MSQYLLESTKTGNFNPLRTLSVSFFVIPEHLASIRSVVLASKQQPKVEGKWGEKMAVGRERKTGNVLISPQEH